MNWLQEQRMRTPFSMGWVAFLKGREYSSQDPPYLPPTSEWDPKEFYKAIDDARKEMYAILIVPPEFLGGKL